MNQRKCTGCGEYWPCSVNGNRGMYSGIENAKHGPEPESIADILDARAYKASQGNWIPASNGTETPFTARNGRRYLYCWQPSTGNHAYLDLGIDIFLSDEEAMATMG